MADSWSDLQLLDFYEGNLKWKKVDVMPGSEA